MVQYFTVYYSKIHFNIILHLYLYLISTILLGRHERSLGRPRHSRENNIQMNLTDTRWKGEDRIHLAQDRDQWCALVKMLLSL
jgi:hypothetical protein